MSPKLKLPSAAGPFAALALLATVGAFAALAAPSSAPTGGHKAAVTQAPASRSLAQSQPPINTGSHVITHAAANTPAPTPTATDTPTVAPTATPVPPQPTATPTQPPAPSWHTVGAYSGSTTGAITTLHAVPDLVRLDWTCTIQPVGTAGSAAQVGFSVAPVNTPGGSGGYGWGEGCLSANCGAGGSTCTSTTMSNSVVNDPTNGGQWSGYDWTLSSNSDIPYTVTVEEWY